MKKIKATCEKTDLMGDTIPGTIRLIGYFDTEDAACAAAKKERKDDEIVAIYNAPPTLEEDLSALEMAEREADWNEVDRFL